MAKVTLNISRDEYQPQYYNVVVNGEGFYNSVNKSVGARIRGEDSFSDDKLFSIGGTGQRVLPGGTFVLHELVHGSKLNEDWGQDEIYALVNVEGLSGSFKTNTVTGNY
ncbi:MAG TPA: hypothetical protein VF861_02495 [Telluria sp.]